MDGAVGQDHPIGTAIQQARCGVRVEMDEEVHVVAKMHEFLVGYPGGVLQLAWNAVLRLNERRCQEKGGKRPQHRGGWYVCVPSVARFCCAHHSVNIPCSSPVQDKRT